MSFTSVNLMGKDIDVEITHYSPYVPAKLNALPENCYPEEGPEIDWVLSKDNPDYDFLDELFDRFEELYDEVSAMLLEEIAQS